MRCLNCGKEKEDINEQEVCEKCIQADTWYQTDMQKQFDMYYDLLIENAKLKERLAKVLKEKEVR